MVCETSQPPVTLKFFAQYLCFPQFPLSLAPDSGEAGARDTKGACPPCMCSARRSGCTQARRSLRICVDSALTRGTCNRGLRMAGFCLSRPLLSCSQLQALGFLCTKRLGRVAPLLGGEVRGCLPWQNVSVCYPVAPKA